MQREERGEMESLVNIRMGEGSAEMAEEKERGAIGAVGGVAFCDCGAFGRDGLCVSGVGGVSGAWREGTFGYGTFGELFGL